MKKVHTIGMAIGLLFGVISVILLLSLGAQSAFPIIILWMLVPVSIKKLVVRFKSKRENQGNN